MQVRLHTLLWVNQPVARKCQQTSGNCKFIEISRYQSDTDRWLKAEKVSNLTFPHLRSSFCSAEENTLLIQLPASACCISASESEREGDEKETKDSHER